MMEDPASWGKAEHVINEALMEIAQAEADGPRFGFSKAHRIASALRQADLLKEE